MLSNFPNSLETIQSTNIQSKALFDQAELSIAAVLKIPSAHGDLHTYISDGEDPERDLPHILHATQSLVNVELDQSHILAP